MSLGETEYPVSIAADIQKRTGRQTSPPPSSSRSNGFSALFFQVQPTDPSVYVIVTGIVAFVSVIGSVIPARRASGVDPMVCLRAWSRASTCSTRCTRRRSWPTA
jgi:ABC-type lipoprotein release transport system permease subunit